MILAGICLPGRVAIVLPSYGSLPIAEEDEEIQLGENRDHHRRAGEALHAEREPVELLEQIKAEHGTLIFAEWYQQSPILEMALYLSGHGSNVVDEPPLRTSRSMIVQSWDTAIKWGQTTIIRRVQR